jgi:CheY-like chemotaxis protein
VTTVTVSGTIRVLLVGGSVSSRTEIACRLREEGCSVHESEHAGDALHNMGIALESSMPFDLLLVDENLSGIDARLFATLVHDDKRFEAVTLLLLGGSDAEVEADFSGAGYAGRVTTDVGVRKLASFLEPAESGTVAGSAPACSQDLVADAAGGSEAGILLVEDNEINMEVALEMLGSIGYGCDRAVNGYEAVEAVKRNRYDLVLMDCQMPLMDGYDATRRIREWERSERPGSRVPIVAVTAHAMKGDRERCMDAGMDDYITKPVESEDLAAAISRWITPGGAGEQQTSRSDT